MSSIVLTGGGTAGHCIPHLAILPELHNAFDNIVYVGSQNGIEKQLMENETDYFSIPTVKFRRKFTLRNLAIPFKLIKAEKEAGKVLKKIKPDVVFSKGGYVSLPVVLAAHKLKIPVVAHESDYSPGLTTKLTAKYCDVVLTTFEDTALKLKNGYYTGSPIREGLFYADRRVALKRFSFGDEKPVLLIFGGSGGSRKINLVTQQTIEKLTEKYYVLHICGRGNTCINKTVNGYYQTEYVSDMASCFKIADMCVSRGGSNALSELMAFKIPTLVIPLGKGESRGDQIENAEYFSRRGMCNVLADENLSPETFLSAVKTLDKSKNWLCDNINAHPSVVGNRKIADILCAYSKKV